MAATAPTLACVTVYGGAAISVQEGALRRGVDIVVGTPGRLIDLARFLPRVIITSRSTPGAVAWLVPFLNPFQRFSEVYSRPPRPQLTRGSLSFETVTNVVLDECDQMLAVGFEEDVEQLMEARSPACSPVPVELAACLQRQLP